MKDIYESCKKALNDRIASPVMGTYIFFWVMLNWPVLVVLWKSHIPIEETIESIHLTRLTLMRSLFAPFLLTVGFLLIYPWAALAVAMYSDWVNFRRIRQKHAYDVRILQNQQDLVIAEAELENVRSAKKHEQTIKQADQEAVREARAIEFAENKKRAEQQNAYNMEVQQRSIMHQRRLEDMKRDLELEAQRWKDEADVRGRYQLPPNFPFKTPLIRSNSEKF